MNIHEYQAKHLLQSYGIPIPKGYSAQSADAFDVALAKLPEGAIVVKAQIHAGGRGKGHFKDGYQGGVQVVPDKETARDVAAKMLNNTLITHQTGPRGRMVKTLYFTEASEIKKEYYLAIVMDRATAQPILIASTEGGVDIETVAAQTPEKIIKTAIDPNLGLRPYAMRQIAFELGFKGEQIKQCCAILDGLYRLFWEKDASLVEINPLILTPSGNLLALDAKINFDDNALYRHPDSAQMRDLNEEDPKEIEASKHQLNYIALDGTIACMVNGAGLAMATMDIIQHFGGKPANFLDVGGGANEEQVSAAFNIILSDNHIKGILVNIFGGIMQCDLIARGIINAAKHVRLSIPLVVRLEGTHVEEGERLLSQSGLSITSADSLAEAAQKIVALAQ